MGRILNGMEQLHDQAPLDIVLAEDDPDLAAMHKRALEGDGHHVDVARDGAEAVAAVRDSDPDLLLLDMQMPRGDGFAVLEQLRGDANTVDQPVVVLSNAELTDAEHHRLKRLGAIEFLAKWKINPRALVDWIRRWASSHTPRRARRRS